MLDVIKRLKRRNYLSQRQKEVYKFQNMNPNGVSYADASGGWVFVLDVTIK